MFNLFSKIYTLKSNINYVNNLKNTRNHCIMGGTHSVMVITIENEPGDLGSSPE